MYELTRESKLMKVPLAHGLSVRLCGVVSCLVLLIVPGMASPQSTPMTPGEVVELWLSVYPDNLERAANMTTLNFRRGISRRDWIDSQGPLLQGLRMKYGKGRILYEDIQGNEARVILRVKVSSWMGSEMKDELYSLVMGEEGLWFIDRVDEYIPNANNRR